MRTTIFYEGESGENLKDFEALDLQKMANENDIEMDIDVSQLHGKIVRFFSGGYGWLAEFTAALTVLEDIIVKKSIDEQKRKNDVFIKRGGFR